MLGGFSSAQPVGGGRVEITLRWRNQAFSLFDACANHPFRAVRDERVGHRRRDAVILRVPVRDTDGCVPLQLREQHVGERLLVVELLQGGHDFWL